MSEAKTNTKSTNTKKLSFYTREGCHLCDDALAELKRIQERIPFQIEIIDLDRNAAPEKRAAYDWEVPVIELDGRKIMKFKVDEKRLVRLLDEPLP